MNRETKAVRFLSQCVSDSRHRSMVQPGLVLGAVFAGARRVDVQITFFRIACIAQSPYAYHGTPQTTRPGRVS